MAKKETKKPVIKPAQESKVSTQIPEKAPKRFSVHLKLIFILGFISFMVYANTLKNGFVLDDSNVITDNTIVTKGIQAIPEILSTPYRRGFFITGNDLYRPLSLVAFATEYQFFGKSPMPYHFINIFLFAACVVLLFLFLDKLFERKKTSVAFLAALLFALHPIHTEVVANIKSCDELLCFFFAFLCLNVFIKYIQAGKMSQLLLGSFCFFLSLLSKETVITFLAVIPLIFFFYRNENKKRSSYITICTAIAAMIFLITRFSVLNYYHANNTAEIFIIDNALAGAPTLALRIATAVLIMGYYIKLLFVPYPLISDYSYNSIPFVGFDNIWFLISFLIYIFLVVFSIKRFIKNHKDPYAFGILFFLITLSLFSNVVFLIGSTLAERFLFFPSVGFCLVLAILIEFFLGKPIETGSAIFKYKKLLGIVIPICLVYTCLTINRNGDWLNNYTLYDTDVKKTPNDSRLNYYFGNELEKAIAENEKDISKQKEIREGVISYLKKAVTIFPDFKEAQSDLGVAYFRNSQYDSAEAHLKRGLQLSPTNNTTIYNLAKVYFSTKKYPQAIELLKKAIGLIPDFAEAHYYLGCCYLYTKQYDSAVCHLNKTLAIDAGNIDANMKLGIFYLQIQKYDSAESHYKKAIELKPDYTDAIFNLGVVYLNTNKIPQAIEQLKKTIAIDPNYIQAYAYLGRVYFNTQQYQEAINIYNKEFTIANNRSDIPYIAQCYQKIGKLDSAKKYEAIANERITK